MFIYKNESAVSDDLCDSFIQEFEISPDTQPGVLYDSEGQSSDKGKKSTDLTFWPEYIEHPVWGKLLTPFIDILQNEIDSYYKRYARGLSTIDDLKISPNFNMQRYLPSEGFFSYHCERGTTVDVFLKRELVWMVYLNDVTVGGETEFYFQQIYERPRKGTLLIWPADWTHVHRGHTSQTQTKYILTGWIERAEEVKFLNK